MLNMCKTFSCIAKNVSNFRSSLSISKRGSISLDWGIRDLILETQKCIFIDVIKKYER